MSKSHKIRIYADINYPDSPRDFISLDTVKVRNANPLTVDCIFLEGGKYADVNLATKAELEILDVGAYNCPAPRSVALIARSEATLNTGLQANALAEKSCTAPIHASFNLSADEMKLLSHEEPYPEKYLRISLCYESGEKVCYSSGWIEVLENFDSNPNYSPISSPEYYTKDEIESLLNHAIVGQHTHENYLEKASNLSDLQDAATSRTNLDVYSKSETDFHLHNISESLEDRLSGISSLVSQNASYISDNLTQISNVESMADQALTQVAALTSRLDTIKSDSSELWFNNGGLSVGQKWTNGVFSFLFTFNMSQDDFELSKSSTWIKTSNYSASNRGFHIGLDSQLNRLFIIYRWTDSLSLTDKSVLNTLNYFKTLYCDSKPHTFALIFNGTQVYKYIDSEEIGGRTSVSNYTESNSTFPLTITNNNGKLSRIKYFNFDITADDSPYTLQDYISGKDEPPSLHSAYNVVLTDSLNWFNTAGSLPSFSSVGRELSIISTGTSAQGSSGNRFGIRVNIPKGSKIKVQSAVNTIPSGNLNFYIRNDEATNVSGALYSARIANGESLNLEYVATSDVKTLAFIWSTASSSSEIQIGDIVILQNFQISVDGALLSLSDNTFNGEVLDNSGQGNHATITGDVKGTHDTAVETLYQKIASRIGNNS